MKNLEFIDVKKHRDSCKYLYKLLNERDFTISHDQNVTFKDHKNFFAKHPYRKWFLIFFNNNFIGSFYISKDNSIGINFLFKSDYNRVIDVINYVHSKFKPLKPIKSVRNKNFTVNVPANNNIFSKELLKRKYQVIQTTFLLKNEN